MWAKAWSLMNAVGWKEVPTCVLYLCGQPFFFPARSELQVLILSQVSVWSLWQPAEHVSMLAFHHLILYWFNHQCSSLFLQNKETEPVLLTSGGCNVLLRPFFQWQWKIWFPSCILFSSSHSFYSILSVSPFLHWFCYYWQCWLDNRRKEKNNCFFTF